MKIYAITMRDGTVRIMRLLRGTAESESARWEDASDITKIEEITEADIPSSREFRDAWKVNKGKIDVDLNKARELIRKRRDFKLQEIDKEAFAETRKPKGDMAAIDAKAQRLRDIPQDPRFISNNVTDLKELNNEI
jgi:hypothetical protein